MESGWRHLARVVRDEMAAQRTSIAAFVHYSGISDRIVRDLRTGNRTSYDDVTLSLLESALGWEHGSVERVLDGREPVRIPDPNLAVVLHCWPALGIESQTMFANLARAQARPSG